MVSSLLYPPSEGTLMVVAALQPGKGAQGCPLLTALEEQCKSRKEIGKIMQELKGQGC